MIEHGSLGLATPGPQPHATALDDGLSSFQQILESLPQLVWTCTSDGSCDYLSPQWVRYTHVPADDQLGWGWLRQVHPDERDALVACWTSAIAEGREVRAEFRLRRHDGIYRWFHTRAVPLRDEDGRITRWFGSNTDITALRRAEAERSDLERQLQQTQRMEALGQLSGGIAHEFNNILAIIAGNTELAVQDVGPAHAALESLRQIETATRRAKALVQQILTFARCQPPEKQVVALAHVVGESASLLRSMLPASVELTVSCAPELPGVLADAAQIEQIVLNLGSNAWQALESAPGRIEIELASVDVDDSEAAMRRDLPRGRYVRLSVRDTGKGIPEAAMKRIFEPFFTTREAGKGTGLGLAVVHGIVQSHGGVIRARSEPGHGAAFDIYFPAVAEARGGPKPTQSERAPRGAGERVLYIDDEEALVWMTTRLLERRGYRVTGVADSGAGLRLFREDPARFDFVVTDMNMPGASGLQLAADLKQARSDIPIVLTSGYLSEELKARAREAGIRAVLHKPGTIQELCEALAKLMAQG